MGRLWLALCALVAASCGGRDYPRPFTALEFAQYGDGPALVAYLAQPDASPSVCDPRSRGPHLAQLDRDVAQELVAALARAEVPPAQFRLCARALLAGFTRESAGALVDAMGDGYRRLARDPKLDQEPQLAAALGALHETFLERPTGLDGDRERAARRFDELRRALDGGKLSSTAERLGDDLLATVELERGRWHGRRVDAGTLDGIARRGDEKLLARFAARLPDAALRRESLRRIIRLKIARSPFPELRADAAAVEEIVLQRGRYPLSLARFVPLRAEVERGKLPLRGVLVKQDVYRQTAALVGYSGDRPGLSVLPPLPLRNALWVTLQGLSRPVTLCGPPVELDPTPCIAPEDVVLKNPLAYLDRDGAFHFAERAPLAEAVKLLEGKGTFELPVELGDEPLVQLAWPLGFARPDDLVLDGPTGAPGPDLDVAVEARARGRLLFAVGGAPGRYLAVVEPREAAGFHVVSRGGAGAAGSQGRRGADGVRGSDGSSASCPSSPGGAGGAGGAGTDGGPGGRGGDGGDGGDVRVRLSCPGGCPGLAEVLRATIASEGGAPGPGGAGGAGGSGGAGGNGGSGTSCTVDGQSVSLASGSSGSRGPDGAQGSRGPDGRGGSPGRVLFR